MSPQTQYPDPMSLDSRADLEQVLAAWHGATLRLEQTHEALRAEVCRLTDELEIKNRELARKNRLADLGQMASHIAHEVRNNLVPLTLYLSLLKRRTTTDPQTADILDKIESGFVSLDSTVNDLLHFTSDRDPKLEFVFLRHMVDEVCTALAPQLAAQRIVTSIELSPQVTLVADRAMLRSALLNLVLNALDVMPREGRLTFAIDDAADPLEIFVSDSGPGLNEDLRRRVFEPFFTTKSGGTGLGLAIVARIAEVHGGNVVATNAPTGGATFILRFPKLLPEAAA